MNQRQYTYNSNGGLGFLWIVLLLVAIFAGMYFVFKGIMWLFTILAPILFILTIILDFKILLSFINFLISRFRKNVLVGILLVILTVLFYPLVTGFLFFKALGNWYLKYNMRKMDKDKYAEYEEVEEIIEEDFLQLPDTKEDIKDNKSSNDYDQLFK